MDDAARVRRWPFWSRPSDGRHLRRHVAAAVVVATLASMLLAPRVDADVTRGLPAQAATVRVSFRVSTSPFVRAAAWVVGRGTSVEATAGATTSIAVTPGLPGLDIRTVEVAPEAVDATIAALKSRLDVAWAEPVGIVRKRGGAPAPAPGPPLAPRLSPRPFAGVSPSDPGFQTQWGLRSAAADAAWATARGLNAGTGTMVAIVDSGVQTDHPDLASRMAPTTTWGRCETGSCVAYSSGNAATYPVDGDGHGTHVAGIVAATTDNGIGVAGVAGDRPVNLIPIKVLNDKGDGTTDGVAAGIAWAVAKGAKVINMSLGGDTDTQTVNSAIDAAADAGVLITISAGNCGGSGYATAGCTKQNEPDFPAAYADPAYSNPMYPTKTSGVGKLVPVASISQSGTVSTFSTQAAYVATGIAAPGDAVYSTYKLSGYSTLSGTSMAAPNVAGAAAVIWSTFPAMSRTEVRDAILNSATANANTIANPNAYGKGILNIDAALYAAQPGAIPSPTASRTATATPTSTSTPTRTPSPTATSTATSTATPTATPTTQPANTVADVHNPRVASIRDGGFVVTWRSSAPLTGAVRWAIAGSASTTLAPDDRGSTTVSTLHFVTVQGLSPSQSYDIDIISGGVAWPTDGSHVTVVTGQTVPMLGPDPASGIVRTSSSTPAPEAIVIFEAATGNERSLPDARLVRSGDGGAWTLDLSGFRARTSLGPFPVDDSTTVAATAFLPDGSFGGLSIPISGFRAGTSVINGAASITQAVQLGAGWNLIGLPLDPLSPVTASNVCASLDNAGGAGTAVEVTRWVNGGWEARPCTITGNDFTLASPAGYAIRVTRPVAWLVTGTPLDGSLPTPIGSGWSLVAPRSPVVPLTSTTLLASLASRSVGTPPLAEIARWHAGQWESALTGLPVNRFDVGAGRAFFVRAPASFAWAIP